jgi:hypothetical protein
MFGEAVTNLRRHNRLLPPLLAAIVAGAVVASW